MSDQVPVIAPAAVCFDGWTPDRKVRFLDHLAASGKVHVSAARVGMSREAAYRLRRRDPLVARAWDAALMQAREGHAEVLADRALEGVEEDVWYRGEVVGTRRKFDNRLLLAHMARLDKIAEARPEAVEDLARFDELMALVAGEEPSGELASGGELPSPRERAMSQAGQIAVDDWIETPAKERTGEDGAEVRGRAEAEAAVLWDEWHARALGTVDRLLQTGAITDAGTVYGVARVSTSPPEAIAKSDGTAEPDTVADGADVSPSPADVSAETPAAPEYGKPEREPRFEDGVRSPTSWLDYCEARKRYHQKQFAARHASKQVS